MGKRHSTGIDKGALGVTDTGTVYFEVYTDNKCRRVTRVIIDTDVLFTRVMKLNPGGSTKIAGFTVKRRERKPWLYELVSPSILEVIPPASYYPASYRVERKHYGKCIRNAGFELSGELRDECPICGRFRVKHKY